MPGKSVITVYMKYPEWSLLQVLFHCGHFDKTPSYLTSVYVRFHFGRDEFFQYGFRSICYNCLHEYPEWNLLQVLYHRGHFDRNEISFRLIRCYINTTSKWDHTNLAVASKLQSKVSCGKETEYAFWGYNHIHNILILFDGWANLPFTTSETRLDY